MKKEILYLGGIILLVSFAAIGAFVYVSQSNLNYQKQKEAEALDVQKEKDKEAADAAALASTQYYLCTSRASTEKDNQLKTNSEYETTDASGGIVYHGKATVFSQIDQTYQNDLDRCESLYK